MAGFLQLGPGRKQWGQFFGGGLLALAYFILIVVTIAPHQGAVLLEKSNPNR
jgi:hypothetical protein